MSATQMALREIVARCPSCRSVVEHHQQGDTRLYRCASCRTSQDLMASLA